MQSYLSGRTQYVEVCGKKSYALEVSSGVPQGTVIGPLLFMIYINDFVNIFDVTSFESFIYADDIQILFASNNRDVLENNVNFYLGLISRWMEDNGFNINTDKSKAMCFGCDAEDFHISMNGVGLQFVDEMKCLGVYLDRGLNFSKHIDYVCARVNGTIRRLYSLDLYLPFRIRRNVANALLMSQLMYALEIYSGTNSTFLRRIQLTFNRIIRFIYRLRIRTHVSPYVMDFIGFTFEDFIKLRMLLLFRKAIMTNCPRYIVDSFQFSRSSRNPQIVCHRIASSIYERSLHVRVLRVWNPLPIKLKFFSFSNQTFKRRLKQYFEQSL